MVLSDSELPLTVVTFSNLKYLDKVLVNSLIVDSQPKKGKQDVQTHRPIVPSKIWKPVAAVTLSFTQLCFLARMMWPHGTKMNDR